jgi:hypothetical protein
MDALLFKLLKASLNTPKERETAIAVLARMASIEKQEYP